MLEGSIQRTCSQGSKVPYTLEREKGSRRNGRFIRGRVSNSAQAASPRVRRTLERFEVVLTKNSYVCTFTSKKTGKQGTEEEKRGRGERRSRRPRIVPSQSTRARVKEPKEVLGRSSADLALEGRLLRGRRRKKGRRKEEGEK